MFARGHSGSDASDEQWDSPAEHGETSSSEECSSEEDEPCSDEEAEKVAANHRPALRGEAHREKKAARPKRGLAAWRVAGFGCEM